MGIRLTGISTPFIGAEWEYTEKQNDSTSPLVISPDQKIRVFISSICGDNGKYDRVRKEIKRAIEDTKLANVYLFEAKDASTLSAGNHYVWALEDSDVCIFLIDNADGITSGVQKEIDIAKKKNIKSLYYFCDEISKEKTALEQSIMGAKYAKSKTVHRFNDLGCDGARSLINDIVSIYSYYCRGRLIPKLVEPDDRLCLTNVNAKPTYYAPKIPKTVVNNIDKCKKYILKLTVGFSIEDTKDEQINTSAIDEWGEQFLTVLFEGKSIKNFNTGMFLDELQKLQEETYFRVVSARWKAIQNYYVENIDECIKCLDMALNIAKETNQPSWVIQDILIDLRNVHLTHNMANNRFSESSAQKELDKLDEDINYPVLDRINESLQEKYISGLYKKKTDSPYAITIGSNYDQYGSLLASSYIVAIYNGSLTHILLFYNKLRDFVFYLCCKFDDWKYREELLKYAIFLGNNTEIKGIQNSYPEVLNDMTDREALKLIEFCGNQPLTYRRISSQLLALGTVGYYLNDSDYAKYEIETVKVIKEWAEGKQGIVGIGQNIFACLSGVAYRMKQDILVEICCLFMDKHYTRWYHEMFKFIANMVNLNKMSEDSAHSFVQHIINVLENKSEYQQIKDTPSFLYVLRKQNHNMTDELDIKIEKYIPEFYNGVYRLETTSEKEKDFPGFIQKYIKRIEHSNEIQGKNGSYFGHGTRDIATVRAILIDGVSLSNSIMDSLIATIANTLLESREGVEIKLDAVTLLICIVVKYPQDFSRNKNIYNKIIAKRDYILDIDNTILSSNIDKIALRIAIALLSIAMGENGYIDILEGLSYIQNDMATSISVSKIVVDYLEIDESILFPSNVEAVILQNALQWVRLNNLDIKWNATRILFMLLRNPDNRNLINQKLINLIESESVYIKNLILRCVTNKNNGVSEKTREYIFSKCENDFCFVVRKVCADVKDNIL